MLVQKLNFTRYCKMYNVNFLKIPKVCWSERFLVRLIKLRVLVFHCNLRHNEIFRKWWGRRYCTDRCQIKCGIPISWWLVVFCPAFRDSSKIFLYSMANLPLYQLLSLPSLSLLSWSFIFSCLVPCHRMLNHYKKLW